MGRVRGDKCPLSTPPDSAPDSITVFETNKGLKKVEERIIKERERRETETDEQKEGRGK